MNRRSFLAWLSDTAAGVALAETVDVERLLWVPKPMIVVPRTPDWRDAIKDFQIGDILHISRIATGEDFGRFIVTATVSSEHPLTMKPTILEPPVFLRDFKGAEKPRTYQPPPWVSKRPRA